MVLMVCLFFSNTNERFGNIGVRTNIYLLGRIGAKRSARVQSLGTGGQHFGLNLMLNPGHQLLQRLVGHQSSTRLAVTDSRSFEMAVEVHRVVVGF
jgi:hypothetical protein